ncbi:MAG: UDP-glycosyltransferase [Zunongwangia sp.]|uniref:UDP-glycosyltransferase n=1 Tax=Zunongwangia profunda TaxID=398743 RepID=UPI000C91EE2B|nr:UDP-glycosyltransferase [Zunongwangia profunda]MAO35670.1 UDP-glycosyltransferase [Zunongwangia sp.]MCC4230167.1 UDP-glycosyltransferase [Zunongwangia profunda]|tara:strand:+ start:10783 stop:12024 length:1242 start_codon:yes stop_codon:yes gene_type:complete
MKRILVIAESIDVNDSSGTKGRVALIKNMIKVGYDVHVYHYTSKNIQIEGARCVVIRETKFSWNYFFSRLERQLRYKLKIDLHEIFEKIWGFSFTLFNDRDSIIKAIKNIDFDPDLVFTFSKGGSFRPHHALLKLPELHDKWVAYIHDPYPMHLYPRPYAWVEPGYLKKWTFVKQMSLKAAYPAFPSELLKDWMGSYFAEFSQRGIVIPHQINNEIRVNSKIDILGWDAEKFNILHAGSLLHARDPRALLVAFETFVSSLDKISRSQCRLVFIGSANNHRQVLQDFSQRVPEIKFLDQSVSFDTVYKMQQETSVNVILEAKSEISPFLPGKFPHCVAANKPIFSLSPALSEVKRLLGENYPYCCEADDKAKILEFLEISYSSWKSGKGTLNRPDLEAYLTEGYLKQKLDSLLN